MKFKQSGVGLIEVLVSMLILSIGLLGVASLQALSLREGVQSNFNARAQIMTDDIIARMLANPVVAKEGVYQNAPQGAEPNPNCRASTCTADQMAAHDLWQVSDQLLNNSPLPEGELTILFTVATQEYGIALTWNAETGSGAFQTPTCTGADNNNAGCLYTAMRL